MSVPPGTTEVVAPGVDPGNIAANVEDHTPQPETPPIVDETPETPEPQDEGLSQLRDIVAGLGTTVETLVARMNAMQSDEQPVKLPWTHRGGAR